MLPGRVGEPNGPQLRTGKGMLCSGYNSSDLSAAQAPVRRSWSPSAPSFASTARDATATTATAQYTTSITRLYTVYVVLLACGAVSLCNHT